MRPGITPGLTTFTHADLQRSNKILSLGDQRPYILAIVDLYQSGGISPHTGTIARSDGQSSPVMSGCPNTLPKPSNPDQEFITLGITFALQRSVKSNGGELCNCLEALSMALHNDCLPVRAG